MDQRKKPAMPYRIGQLAQRFAVPVETLRYYEKIGLLPAPQRNAGNYRVYDEPAVERLSFIRNCRSLGMHLDEIRRLLELRDAPQQDCHEVNDLLDTHIRDVMARIGELQILQQQLQMLRARCDSPVAIGCCEILGALTNREASPEVDERRQQRQGMR